MTAGSKTPLKLFYCYAREDKALRDELDIHLSSLKCQNLVTSWYDGEIGSGTEWEKEIDTRHEAKPVTQWTDRDEAFWNITVGIHKAILDLHLLLKTKQRWIDEGNTLYGLKRYEEALAAYEQAIRLNPNDAIAYHNKGFTLDRLGRSKEAQQCYEKARQLGYNG